MFYWLLTTGGQVVIGTRNNHMDPWRIFDLNGNSYNLGQNQVVATRELKKPEIETIISYKFK